MRPSADPFAQLLLLSLNNSKDGVAACIEATKCRLWATPHGQPLSPLLAQLQPTHQLQVIHVPACGDLLDACGTRHYLYTKAFDEAAGDALLCAA